MLEPKVPYLCGGVLFLLLFASSYKDHTRRDSKNGETDDHSASAVMTSFVSIFHSSDVPVPTTPTSEFSSCEKNGSTAIPFNDVTTLQTFEDNMRKHYPDVIARVTDFLQTHMMPTKKDWLAIRLVELIEEDDDILENEEFCICPDGTAVTKAEIRNMTSFVLEPLLLGILYYAMKNRANDNKFGTATLAAWSKASRGRSRTYIRADAPDLGREITVEWYQPPEVVPADETDSNSALMINEENVPSLNDLLTERVVQLGKTMLETITRVDRAMARDFMKNSSSSEEPHEGRYIEAEPEEEKPAELHGSYGKVTIKQKGDNNLIVNGNNSVITMVSNRQSAQTNAADLRAIKNFSQEYYQLIVTSDDIMEVNAVVVNTERALIKGTVPEEIYESCSSLTPDGQEIMKTIPAIICNENTDYHGRTDPEQSAIYARIEKIKVGSSGVKIYYRCLDLVPQHILNENSIDFGLRCDSALTELNRCGWSVKKINLFEAFEDVGLGNLRSPR